MGIEYCMAIYEYSLIKDQELTLMKSSAIPALLKA